MFQLPEKIPVTFTSSQGPWRELYSPNNGKKIAEVQLATEEDLRQILASTEEAQEKMASLRPYERSSLLRKVADKIKQREDEFSFAIASEGGKPLKDARIEVSRAQSTLELCAEETLRLTGDVIPMERTAAGKDHMAFTLHDPIGAVLAISAFNHPLNLLAHQVGCAIAAGNSVVLKPSSSTPICAHLLENLFREAGLPKEALRVVNTEARLMKTLVESPMFSFLNFIGSPLVGWELRKQVAPGTRLALEHGGQATAIVRHDADCESAVKALVKGAFYHAGQVCISTQVVFVHKLIEDKFIQMFKSETLKLITGPATDEKTDVGPLINKTEVQRIQSWIKEAQEEGAQVICGNEANENFLSPTIVTHVPKGSKLMEQEVFGPVVCINSYENETEVISALNRRRYQFETALFTNDLSTALKLAKMNTSMTFVINNHTAFRVDQMPFGGHKESGLGMGGVQYAIHEMSRLKQIIIKLTP
jgi:acyl-CoA reductase-like NAD-dependent aldehyde dehydrogenase